MIAKFKLYGVPVEMTENSVKCKDKTIERLVESMEDLYSDYGPEDGYLRILIDIFGKNLKIISITEDQNLIY